MIALGQFFGKPKQDAKVLPLIAKVKQTVNATLHDLESMKQEPLAVKQRISEIISMNEYTDPEIKYVVQQTVFLDNCPGVVPEKYWDCLVMDCVKDLLEEQKRTEGPPSHSDNKRRPNAIANRLSTVWNQVKTRCTTLFKRSSRLDKRASSDSSASDGSSSTQQFQEPAKVTSLDEIPQIEVLGRSTPVPTLQVVESPLSEEYSPTFVKEDASFLEEDLSDSIVPSPAPEPAKLPCSFTEELLQAKPVLRQVVSAEPKFTSAEVLAQQLQQAKTKLKKVEIPLEEVKKTVQTDDMPLERLMLKVPNFYEFVEDQSEVSEWDATPNECIISEPVQDTPSVKPISLVGPNEIVEPSKPTELPAATLSQHDELKRRDDAREFERKFLEALKARREALGGDEDEDVSDNDFSFTSTE